MLHSFEWSQEHGGKVGEIEELRQSLFFVRGLTGVAVGEIVVTENGSHGRVSGIAGDRLEVMSFSRTVERVGSKVASTGQLLHVSVGDGLLGQMIDAFGHVYGSRKIAGEDTEARQVEVAARGIAERKTIDETLLTGVTMVDLMMPLGKGQRQLIIGDRKTGKSHMALQTAITQAKAGTIVVYAMIGRREDEIKRLRYVAHEQGVYKKWVMVAAPADAPSGEIFMVPYTAMAVAEHFCEEGRDVLLVLDDLGRHADCYREMSLLGGRFPGRESYPGDIFFVHARLLERAGNFVSGKKHASISCLPIVETIESDLTGYLQTNIMSMTDGHLFFDGKLYAAGERPAINLFLSVTRVGRQTMSKLAREVEQHLLTALKGFDDIQRYLRFGPELSVNAREMVRLAKGIRTIFAQVSLLGMNYDLQLFLVSQLWQNKTGDELVEMVKRYREDSAWAKKVKEKVAKVKDWQELIKLTDK